MKCLGMKKITKMVILRIRRNCLKYTCSNLNRQIISLLDPRRLISHRNAPDKEKKGEAVAELGFVNLANLANLTNQIIEQYADV